MSSITPIGASSQQENTTSMISPARDFNSIPSQLPINSWLMTIIQNPFMAGGCAGFGESLACYWTVTWKNCRQQNIALPQSIRGFYKGFSLNAICMTMFFSVMTGVNHFIKKEQKQIRAMTGESMLAKFVPAIFGGISASILLNPIEVATIQRIKNKDKSLSDTMKKIYRGFGLKGFYKGFAWALARNIPYSLSFNLIGPQAKEQMESFFRTRTNEDNRTLASIPSTIIGVGTAGCLAGIFTQAIDNVKTQVQARTFSGGWEASKAIYQQGGIQRLFAGLIPRTVRTTGGSVVAVGILEFLNRFSQPSRKN